MGVPQTRDVEDLLAERGLDVSYDGAPVGLEVRAIVRSIELRRRRSRPTSQWHLDEMAVMIAGRQFWLWRAVDGETRFSTCSCKDGATRPQL
jgi:putative transposase